MKLTRKARTKGPDYVPAEPKPRRDPGRPTAYDERVTIATACAAARMGATDQEIAQELGVGVSTLYLWYRNYPELLEAVRAAGAAANERVARSLYSRANGYTQKVEKVFSNGLRLEVIEQVQPDVTAQQWWLKNRDRANWRDTREVDLVVPMQNGQTEETSSSDRQLAMAALALFHEVDAEPAGPVIDGEINEESDDDFDTRTVPEESEQSEAGDHGRFGSYDEDPGEVALDFDQ
jgi:AcrR family transcriptional regulator